MVEIRIVGLKRSKSCDIKRKRFFFLNTFLPRKKSFLVASSALCNFRACLLYILAFSNRSSLVERKSIHLVEKNKANAILGLIFF